MKFRTFREMRSRAAKAKTYEELLHDAKHWVFTSIMTRNFLGVYMDHGRVKFEDAIYNIYLEVNGGIA